jgi:hypothetical protein
MNGRKLVHRHIVASCFLCWVYEASNRAVRYSRDVLNRARQGASKTHFNLEGEKASLWKMPMLCPLVLTIRVIQK